MTLRLLFLVFGLSFIPVSGQAFAQTPEKNSVLKQSDAQAGEDDIKTPLSSEMPKTNKSTSDDRSNPLDEGLDAFFKAAEEEMESGSQCAPEEEAREEVVSKPIS